MKPSEDIPISGLVPVIEKLTESDTGKSLGVLTAKEGEYYVAIDDPPRVVGEAGRFKTRKAAWKWIMKRGKRMAIQ